MDHNQGNWYNTHTHTLFFSITQTYTQKLDLLCKNVGHVKLLFSEELLLGDEYNENVGDNLNASDCSLISL